MFNHETIFNKSRQSLAVLNTTMGTINIEMYWDHAPLTCNNFIDLIRTGYYNDTIFHRVLKDFLIHGGDPTGTGRGGQSIYGQYFVDEINDNLKHAGAGIVSMANMGPNVERLKCDNVRMTLRWLRRLNEVMIALQPA